MRSTARSLLTVSCSALALVVLAFTGSARADGPYEGAWRASATRVDVVIRSWGADCGPRPQSFSSGGGGSVQVTQEGDHLIFRGQRTTRTDGCWSENRAVRKVSTSVQGGTWRTVCRTPPGDSRGETGTYTLRANGGDSLAFTDLSEYDWALNASRCTAAITTTQTFSRVRAAGTEPVATPTPTPTPTPPEPVERACTPGAPTQIAMRPSRVQVQPGERSCLRARVTDATGCTVPGQTIAWAVERPAGRSGELADGCFQAAATAAEAEGEFRVVATSGALRGTAVVVVRTQDLSDLIARRGELGAVGVLAGSGATAQSQDAASVAARAVENGGGSSLLWPVLGAAVALVLLLGGVALLLGGKKKKKPSGARELTEPEPAQPAASAPAAASVLSKTCPACHLEVEGETTFCPKDGTRLVPSPRGGPATPSQALICPTCRRGAPPGARFCPHDSDELIPYAMFAARAKERDTATSGKPMICPKCGERFSATTTFCGKDGSPLVTVN
jgi:hypothetical protein